MMAIWGGHGEKTMSRTRDGEREGRKRGGRGEENKNCETVTVICNVQITNKQDNELCPFAAIISRRRRRT
jgi:hypothetical protein